MKVLEEGDSPSEIPSADVKSLRPLKMVRTSQFRNKLCAFLFLLFLPQRFWSKYKLGSKVLSGLIFVHVMLI